MDIAGRDILGRILGQSWAHLGIILGPSWSILIILEASWTILGHPEAVLGILELSLEQLGSMLLSLQKGQYKSFTLTGGDPPKRSSKLCEGHTGFGQVR